MECRLDARAGALTAGVTNYALEKQRQELRFYHHGDVLYLDAIIWH
jgi:hypothetical protein